MMQKLNYVKNYVFMMPEWASAHLDALLPTFIAFTAHTETV